MTVIAVTETPSIVCPPWCSVTREEHIDQLPGLEGEVIHWSSTRRAGARCGVRIASTTFPDGTPDPTEHMSLFIEDDGYHDGASLDAAEEFAKGILAALKEARA